ncbi:DUF1822 family protein [Scytonema sp. UIC 10036]|nr:DUF1822 family protein [Scytonema sp. UIC 10036]
MSLEFERLSVEAIVLESHEITQAIERSSKIPSHGRQWQTYLNSLALFVFKKWLEERDDNLMVDYSRCTIAKPGLANLIPTVTNLQVGKFRVGLITLGSSFEEQVYLPRAIVELSEFIPHFYVLVEVLEEQECGVVRGFISYLELLANINASPAIYYPQADWNYPIPLTWFDNDPNRLLLYLRALEPERISLPTVSANPKPTLSSIDSQLVSLLPQLQTPERELWEILTWEQGSVVLTTPELIDWIYNLQTNNEVERQIASLQKHLFDLIKIITQPAINVGRWLWDELDEIGQQLSWTLLPRFREAGAMRSPTEEFAAIQSQLQAQGIEISLVARSGYQNFLLAGVSLRLYAVTWNSSTGDDPNTWSLLLILATPLPNALPENLKLRVSDQTGILVEEELSPQQRGSYLYTRVVGGWDEKFIVTASLGDGIELTLPPFAFDLTK